MWKVIRDFEKRYPSWLDQYSSTFDREDLFQIGCIGLFNAARNFDNSLGYAFSTYAVKAIRNTLLTEIGKNTCRTTGESHDSLNSSFEEIEDGRETLAGTDEVNLDRLYLDMVLEKALKDHPEEEEEIRKAYSYLNRYGEGAYWADIAREEGIGYSELMKKINLFKKYFKEAGTAA